MKLSKILEYKDYELLTNINDPDLEIKRLFATDLLSNALSNLQEDDCLITIIANLNTIAIASLLNIGCVIITSNIEVDEEVIKKAKQKDIVLFKTKFDHVRTILDLHEKS